MKNDKQQFLDIYKTNIQREGSDKLIEYLLSPASDFFTAPASTKFHNSVEGGLCRHTLNVYSCLNDYLSRKRVKNEYGLSYEPESVAVAALLHDVCKINCYKKGSRNVKDEKGVWQSVPVFEYEDRLPYGHGEKSVYIVTGFMRLTREEAFAIRYHMGFSGAEDKRSIGDAFERFPLALALFVADMEATFYMESSAK